MEDGLTMEAIAHVVTHVVEGTKQDTEAAPIPHQLMGVISVPDRLYSLWYVIQEIVVSMKYMVSDVYGLK